MPEYAIDIEFSLERESLLAYDVVSFLQNFEMLLNRCAYAALENFVDGADKVHLQRDAERNSICDLKILVLQAGSVKGKMLATLREAWQGKLDDRGLSRDILTRSGTADAASTATGNCPLTGQMRRGD